MKSIAGQFESHNRERFTTKTVNSKKSPAKCQAS